MGLFDAQGGVLEPEERVLPSSSSCGWAGAGGGGLPGVVWDGVREQRGQVGSSSGPRLWSRRGSVARATVRRGRLMGTAVVEATAGPLSSTCVNQSASIVRQLYTLPVLFT